MRKFLYYLTVTPILLGYIILVAVPVLGFYLTCAFTYFWFTQDQKELVREIERSMMKTIDSGYLIDSIFERIFL